MSIITPTEYQAACDVVQSIAAFDKPHNRAKNHSFSRADTPRFKTCSSFDMKVKGVWRARRDLYRSLSLTPTGRISFGAADLYEDILDLWQSENRVQNFNHRDGCYYWGRPIAKWAKKYGCTEDQFDGWLKILRDRGLIATCMMKTKTNMLQIRPLVAEGSACLSGWPDSHNYAHLLNAETLVQQGPAGSFGPNAAAAKQPCGSGALLALTKDLGLAVGVACKGLLDSVAGEPATKSITINSSGITGKNNPNPKVKSNPASPESVFEIPKIDKTSLKNGKQALTIARVWEGAQKEFHPTYAVSLTREDCKVLRDVRNKLHAAGVSPDLMVRFAVEHWFSALFGISGGSGLKFTPKTFSSYLGNFLAHFKTHYVSPGQAAEEKAKHAEYVAKWEAEAEAQKAAKEALPKKSSALAQAAQAFAATKAVTAAVVQVMAADTPTASEPVIEAMPEPEPVPVACPAIILADPVTPVKDLPSFDDEIWPEPSLEACRAWSKQAMADKHTKDEAARIKNKTKLTASASYHYKPHATA